jgi:hypothetical protein
VRTFYLSLRLLAPPHPDWLIGVGLVEVEVVAAVSVRSVKPQTCKKRRSALPPLIYCGRGFIIGRGRAALGVSTAPSAAWKGVVLVPPVRLTTMVKAAG